MSNLALNTVQTDANGCISLAAYANAGDCFHISVDEKQRIILEPLHDIPENEQWIYENPEIFESIKTGIEQSLKGDVKSLGTFSQYADE